jgi:hypothetical protein
MAGEIWNALYQRNTVEARLKMEADRVPEKEKCRTEF